MLEQLAICVRENLHNVQSPSSNNRAHNVRVEECDNNRD